MERHERYDPEDIESLLSERGFDELLPDERAFVLRHVNGRGEYERMRALLHYVRPDEWQRGGIEPEERVRENVMAAFRAQQQPAWRIWLNSVSLCLAPKEAAAAWRPALAFGSLALLIVAGVVVVRQFEGAGKDPALAEVRVKDANERNEVDEVKEAKDVREALPSSGSPEVSAQEPIEDLSATTRDARAEVKTMTHSAAAAATNEQASEADHFPRKEVGTVREAAALDMAEESEKMPPMAAPDGADSYLYDASSLSHVVTADELTRNMSTTNASGAVAVESVGKVAKTKQRAKAGAATSRSMADAPGVLDLVASGW
ncbi:MAG TPA: hypothetical protein PKJ19_06315 [Flavobacteriales bacterium]|nr:hypothetical protein [Flavobacteriales bacterium]HNU57516.1 hypothetical protein [Flavobacteriales bacterium]